MSSCQHLKSSTFIYSIVHRDSCPTSSVGPSINKANREELRSLMPSHLHLQLSCQHLQEFHCKSRICCHHSVTWGSVQVTLNKDLLLTSSLFSHPLTPGEEFIVKFTSVSLFLMPKTWGDLGLGLGNLGV